MTLTQYLQKSCLIPLLQTKHESSVILFFWNSLTTLPGRERDRFGSFHSSKDQNQLSICWLSLIKLFYSLFSRFFLPSVVISTVYEHICVMAQLRFSWPYWNYFGCRVLKTFVIREHFLDEHSCRAYIVNSYFIYVLLLYFIKMPNILSAIIHGGLSTFLSWLSYACCKS